VPIQILSAIPLWVFPLLLGLVLLGARARREREVPILLIYSLPLLGLLPLSRALGLALPEMALSGLALGWLAGHHLQHNWILWRGPRRVRVRGEWLTMVTLLGIFALNLALGMAEGIAPALTMTRGACLGFGLLAGILSGSLAGRAIRVALTPI